MSHLISKSILLSGFVLAFSSCATLPTASMHGLASWYGKEHQGQKTASGERFEMHDLTAAHRTLPFGTRVRVTSHATHASVVVRINDRGPFTRDRVIDLSYEAARRIGLTETGVTEVDLEKL